MRPVRRALTDPRLPMLAPLLAAIAIVAAVLVAPALAAPPTPAVLQSGDGSGGGSAAPAPGGGFLLGASYEGPADQAWQMWRDDRFDPASIAEDFARARAANLTVLRIFVQAPLAEDIGANRWEKLDRVLDLADRHGLRLIVTLADYTAWDVEQLAALDGKIAARYKGRATILAFDLKNEPRFGDLALTRYAGGPAPLQQAGLVDQLRRSAPALPPPTPTPVASPAADAGQGGAGAPSGARPSGTPTPGQAAPEMGASPSPSPQPAATPAPWELRAPLDWLPREEIAAYRASEAGRRSVPTRLDDEQAFVYVNALRGYLRMLEDAGVWIRGQERGTIVRYLQSEEVGVWQPLVAALNDTLGLYVEPRLAAIRRADPERLVTIAHVDPTLAVLPINGWLDYRTFHRYPASASEGGVRALLALFEDVRDAVPDRPLVLGEFGVANDATDEEASARLEAQIVAGVRERGGAGALKWMLNDFPSGANPRENSFGMFRGDGTAKPVVEQFRSFGPLELAEGATGLDAIRPAGSATRRLDPACEARGIAPAAGRPARATAWPEGTRLEMLGPEEQGDGLRWKQVRDPCGQVGWLPARFAAPTGAP